MAYAWVKTGKNAANSNVINFTPTNTGDLLVWFASTSSGAGSPTVTSLVDNNSISWTQAVATFQDASTAFHCTVYYLANCEGGITSVTATFNGGTPGTTDIWIAEYSGIAAATPLITQAHAAQTAPGTGTDAATSGSVSVGSGVPALILGLICDTQNTGTIAAGTGFTSRSSTTGTARLVVEDKRITVTGSQAATGTPSNGTDVFFSIMAAFAEPSGIPTLVVGQGSPVSGGTGNSSGGSSQIWWSKNGNTA